MIQAAAVCESDVPWLDYEVALDITADSSVTMTWVDPESLGRDIVITDLPTSGRLLWPGAELDAEDQPIDWPGWTLDGAVWVEDDTDAWVRGPLTVRVEMDGAQTDLVVTYPTATDACVASPDGGTSPATGGNGGPSADTGAAATPPSTSTVEPVEPTESDASMAIIAILAVLFAASVAAADRNDRLRRR